MVKPEGSGIGLSDAGFGLSGTSLIDTGSSNNGLSDSA